MTTLVTEPMAGAIPATMQIGAMTAVGEIGLRSVPVPKPAPGEALVRLRATAICTWEQRSYSGAQANKFPFIGGHEMAGEVVKIGPGGANELKVGDRVAIGPSSCGRCHWCLTGQDRGCVQHYAGAVVYGDAWGPGGFAQYKIHPANGLYDIGDASFELASLTEPLSCALHSARLLDIRVGQDAVVLGAGVMGLMNVLALKKHGARVIVSEIDADRLAKAKQMGADELIDASKEDPVARVRVLTEGRGAQAVVAAIGHASANEQGTAMLSEKGRYVLFAAAHPEPELTISPNTWHNRETGLFGVVSKEKQDFYAATRLIQYGQVDLRPLIEKAYPLEQIRVAMDQAIRPGTYRIVVAQS
jgi:L-iditol 2-dehydrogenase